MLLHKIYIREDLYHASSINEVPLEEKINSQ